MGKTESTGNPGKDGAADDNVAAEQLKAMRYRNAMKSLKELDPTQVEDVMLGAEQELSTRTPGKSITWQHIKEFTDDIKESIKVWGKVGGISSGLPSLDATIGGLRRGQTLLIAGESNNGKSALAAQMAVNISKVRKVGYISLEMTAGDNGARINHMNGGTEEDIKIDGLDIYFQSTNKMTYRDLEPLVKQAKSEGIEIIFLDYLQFLGRSLTMEEVGKMSQTIKNLAIDYKLPFVVIVSLRKGMTRSWKDIELDDLMGTSAIGYDADNTIVVSRKNLDGEYDEDHVYVKVLKLRNMRKTKDNQFMMFDWKDTRITEPVVPLHLMRQEPVNGNINDKGEVHVVGEQGDEEKVGAS